MKKEAFVSRKGFKNHPYIPNSDQTIQNEMLQEIGLETLEDLHSDIPEELILNSPLNIPQGFRSEIELRRHVNSLLKQNISCEEAISFLGYGCWQHYVPAVCDEINSRSEFLTAYAGEPYNDLGRFQAVFEYESLLAELLDTEVVSVPTFDWAQAAATSLRMASRVTGRNIALFAGTISPQRLSVMVNYCDPDVKLQPIAYSKKTGKMDLEDLKEKLNDNVAAVYFENPSSLGFLEDQGVEIAKLAKEFGALLVVGVDPISLGVLETPVSYGASILCGDLQPLGIHMNYGGGQSGFISTQNQEELVDEFPSRLFGMAPTIKDGEIGFGDVAYERTSFGNLRDKAKEYVGTQTSLWAITAGVYLSLMGPQGMKDIGNHLLQKTKYTIDKLSAIPGVKGSLFDNTNFKEFIVDFNGTGKTVEEINAYLLENGVFGGVDLSQEFPEFGESALFCVTEVHTLEDIDRLTTLLEKFFV